MLFGICQPFFVLTDQFEPVDVVDPAVLVAVHDFHQFLKSDHAQLSLLVFELFPQKGVKIFLGNVGICVSIDQFESVFDGEA